MSQPIPLPAALPRTVCCYCTQHGEGGGRFESVMRDGVYPTSHGICPVCRAKLDARVAARKLELREAVR
ncbi:MAG: hypothetical protein KIS92_20000 [Planctomycetota bacterium]|nr:hypothetical protein [Planctomycetota bacterium]